MGDDGLSGPPAKKRGATRQISKDDRSDSEEERHMPSEHGSFQKASDEVIASRRIVKARRSAPSEAPAAPNPFASIRLVPSTTSSAVPCASLACAPALALSGESVEKEDLAENQQVQLRSKDVGGKGDAEPAGESVESKDMNIHTCTGFEDALKCDNAEEKLEMLKSPASADDSKGNTIKSEVGICRESANPLTTDKGLEKGESNDVQSEDSKENFRKSQVADENKQSTEENAAMTSKEMNEDKCRDSGAVNIGNVADDRGTKKYVPTVKATASRSFSFGTSPFLFETPTAFASFSSSRTTFGSGTASGTSSGTSFAFGMAGSEGQFASSLSPFSNSNGSSLQLGNAPVSIGPPSQPPASALQFQGGVTPTGEEEETVVFGADATLFEFIDGGWKERGKGELRVNVPSSKVGKARLLMRRKGNFRLILNASLFADMKMTSMDSRGVSFACVNSAVEEKSGLTTYALKFKDNNAAGNFRDAVDANKNPLQEILKTPKNSPSSLSGP